MQIENARVHDHRAVGSEYRMVVLAAPGIAAAVKPGQFVHVRVPGLDGVSLRRPFSVFDAPGGLLKILYKPVGRGTAALTRVDAGADLDVLGPLGNGFPEPRREAQTILVAGGYGVAPLHFLAARAERPGRLFAGAASASHLLCLDAFRDLGWQVHAATEDGSAGTRGLVTAALDDWLARNAGGPLEFFACGPDGLLRAVGDRAARGGWEAWLSMDKRMGCGVGACLACVQAVRLADGSAAWKRVCRDGPVFAARDIVWD